ncbi:MAG: nucleoside-diphosphate sugar epimerase/dehydratase [Oscillospiraceae bacterium]|nr:nucleoside-diphosphate sugar epimerase/dehydratase [Oscillospiraceae bacterium]
MKSKILKILSSLFFDFAVAFASMMAALFISQEIDLIDIFFFFPCFVFAAATLIFFYVLKIYSIFWKYARFIDHIKIFIASGAAIFVVFVTQAALNRSFSLQTYIVAFAISCLVIYVSRNIVQIANTYTGESNYDDTLVGNIMIIGGGSAGNEIINDINLNNKNKACQIKCIIDDDPAKKGVFINGVQVIGGKSEIIKAVKQYDINVIVFAIPSCSGEEKAAFLRICQKTNCKLKIIPSLYQLLLDDSGVDTKKIRDVEIEDLLGRDPVSIDLASVMNYVSKKVVMVTGGGGSIGSELCRQIARYEPKEIIIFDIYENNAYEIQNELSRAYPDLKLTVLIGSVRDSKRMNCVFDKYRPQIVYHAAAHKHVPLMEDSPNESIKNNVFGTLKTAECADKYGVQKFVLISTDKAVNPTNIMGATKRICEMIVQSYNRRSNTEFVAVRFGNVLGSNGSVIPVFKKQISEGGPVTVTDPNIIRFFMTIPEAVSLVLQAGATAKGGEIFVLDMGKPVKILDLAENLIRLSGLVPYSDIDIKFTGLRPGEKLYEEMLMDEEGLTSTENHLIFIGKPIEFDEDVFWKRINNLKNVMYDDSVEIKKLVNEIIGTYHY